MIRYQQRTYNVFGPSDNDTAETGARYQPVNQAS
jgi:hypothetical protein